MTDLTIEYVQGVLDDWGNSMVFNRAASIARQLVATMQEKERLRQGIRDVLPNLLAWDASLEASESYLRLKELSGQPASYQWVSYGKCLRCGFMGRRLDDHQCNEAQHDE